MNHWIDNADSYICPICGFETNNPNRYESARCPKCGFQDVKDVIQDVKNVIMNKAILVIDMPNSCSKCPLFGGSYADMCCKGMNNRGIDYPYPEDFRQDWCPLKPAPEKLDVPDFDNDVKAKSDNALEVGMYMYDRGHSRGYNACIRKILGK